MYPNIEDYENPQVGDFFMVKTVKFFRNYCTFEWPVFAESHIDQGYQNKEHYHIDWRFMNGTIILEHRDFYKKVYPNGWGNAVETENYSPVMKSEVIEETCKPWQYLRDFKLPQDYAFTLIRDRMLNLGVKMKKMRCPHHGTNLTSCKPVDDIVTCPQHGLKWNVKTGELI